MKLPPKKILIIQTAFLGDTILATSVAEELHCVFPNAKIFLLIKKDNELLFENHPFLNIWIHDKSKKYASLFSLIKKIRQENFDIVINLHRYLSSSILTILSNAQYTTGFYSFLSFLFTRSLPHQFHQLLHETDRYHQLLEPITSQKKTFSPKLYPSETLPKNFTSNEKYVCLFPGSIWATKQLPPLKWIELTKKFSNHVNIYLCGSSDDYNLCEYIRVNSNRNNIFNIAGQFSILEVAAIMKQSIRVYVNDSAPLHIASALNIPVTAFFCSTVKEFGFFPLSQEQQIIEVKNLACRPCGIHGYKKCPKKHFQCGINININEVIIH